MNRCGWIVDFVVLWLLSLVLQTADQQVPLTFVGSVPGLISAPLFQYASQSCLPMKQITSGEKTQQSKATRVTNSSQTGRFGEDEPKPKKKSAQCAILYLLSSDGNSQGLCSKRVWLFFFLALSQNRILISLVSRS